MYHFNSRMVVLAIFAFSITLSCSREIKEQGVQLMTTNASTNSEINTKKKERKLLFISNREYYLTSPTRYDLYASNDDGSNLARLTYTGNAGRGSWSANGQHIAFAAGATNNRDIYVLNANGHGLRNITNTPGYDEDWPEWSVTGNQLIFSSRWDFTTGTALSNHEIFSYNMENSSFTRLTIRAQDDKWPTYSPDGNRIAFQSNPIGGNTDVFVMNADGSNVIQLTTHTALDQMPAWSPDGTEIAFMSSRDGNPNIYKMMANGSGQTALTTHSAADARPSWSWELNKILFTSQRIGARWNVFAMNPDGSGQTAITSQTLYHNDFTYRK